MLSSLKVLDHGLEPAGGGEVGLVDVLALDHHRHVPVLLSPACLAHLVKALDPPFASFLTRFLMKETDGKTIA